MKKLHELMLSIYAAKDVAAYKAKKGQCLAEYGLILALVVVVCIAALTLLGTNINKVITDLATNIGKVNGSAT